MEGEPEANRERYLRLRELFLELDALAPELRAPRLAQLSRSESGLAHELAALFERSGGTSFLEQPLDAQALMARAEPSWPQALRERLGPYRILRILGRGASGVVYLAEEEHLRRPVALKVLHRGSLSVEGLLRFRRESELLARLDHPGIARIYVAGIERSEAGDEPWFAMEYVAGSSLGEHARAAALDLRARVRLLAELADAVQAAHEAGVIHRDLKPENVLVDGHGRVKVLDFGVARATGGDLGCTRHTVTGEVVGTIAYMSPEQAAGRAAGVDARADVYALGTLLYELVAGRLPLPTRGVPIHEALDAIIGSEPQRLLGACPGVDRELEKVVLQALEKEPRRRQVSAAEFAADLRRWLAGEPVRAQPPGRWQALLRAARRQRTLAASTAATFLALLSGLAIALHSLDEARAAERFAELQRDASQRLSDLRTLHRLSSLADRLWPAAPEQVDDLSAWIAEARAVAERAPEHRRALAAFRSDGHGTLEPGASEERARSLAQQAELVAELERFLDPRGGVLQQMERRLAFSGSLARRTVEEHRAAWLEACASIARSPRYAGLEIEPQVGLIPLGPDPDSGLWEFAHFGSSGELPRREAATGRISLGAETGLVLVLIPGGRYLQGAQREDARAPNYDPLAQPQDGPPREVELAPFFLSKFELTRGQWLRVMGTEPSPIWTQGGEPAGPRHPLEFVSWDEARAALLRLDLELPTEAQWEYAARGGKATVWWTGNEPGSLLGAENLWGRHSEWEKFPADLAQDPWLRTSPVGSLRPNPYGLHDVLGNVKEWCLDDYFGRYFDRPLRPGDGLVQGTGDAHRSLRGGNHAAGVEEARVALHTDNLRGYRSRAIGLRPARDLRRSSP